jgi:insertion element IS1 protein InsB
MQLSHLNVEFHVEADEFWSFVGNKKHQRWTSYALDKATGVILAWHNGGRTDADFLQLKTYLEQIPIKMYFTDNWGAYLRHIPAEQHYVGKDQTQRIERRNLNFRIHIKRLTRRTICFSKSAQIHDNVIGMYIQKYYFNTEKYSNYT